MFLGIDIGNSNISIGLVDDGNVVHFFRVKTDTRRTEDEYGIIFSSLFRVRGVSGRDIKCAVISSVVPPLNTTFATMLRKFFDIDPIILAPGVKTGLKMNVKNPVEVGADRVANAVAAYNIFKRDAIVIDFGTATTFDYVTKDGEFMGGVIAPGIEISMDVLSAKTAKLPRVEFRNPGVVIGKSTIESLQSGIFHGYVSLTMGIIKKMKGEIGKDVFVVATGGCSRMMEVVRFIDVFDEHLTIKGLYFIGLKNQ